MKSNHKTKKLQKFLGARSCLTGLMCDFPKIKVVLNILKVALFIPSLCALVCCPLSSETESQSPSPETKTRFAKKLCTGSRAAQKRHSLSCCGEKGASLKHDPPSCLQEDRERIHKSDLWQKALSAETLNSTSESLTGDPRNAAYTPRLL